jgi:hypothetical protein
MWTAIALNLLGFFVFLFIFWKKLKEDYIGNQVFSSAIYITVGVLASYFLSDKFFSAWWFWAGFLGFIVGLVIATIHFKLRFYETFEAAIIAFLPWLSFVFLADAIRSSSWFSLGISVFTLIFVFLFGFLNSRYRDFGWYKSGKIGFAGLTTLGVYFLTRGVVAIILPFMLSFVRNYEVMLSGLAAFFLFLAVFNLSRKSA